MTCGNTDLNVTYHYKISYEDFTLLWISLIDRFLYIYHSPSTAKNCDWQTEFRCWSYCDIIFSRCAKAAASKNYTHFGIQGYGECWSGPNSAKTYSRDGVENRFTQRPEPKPWVGCVGDNFERCRGGNAQCVGQEKSNFVYAFLNGKDLSYRVKFEWKKLNFSQKA